MTLRRPVNPRAARRRPPRRHAPARGSARASRLGGERALRPAEALADGTRPLSLADLAPAGLYPSTALRLAGSLLRFAISCGRGRLYARAPAFRLGAL